MLISEKIKPLVSVIVPNYNHARFLDERIQSILNQTYQNFELIILDDRSSDNSVEVIMKYKDNPHTSHIVVNKENSGSTFIQWNKGLELARGEWIWIAESDDFCEDNMLECLMEQKDKSDNVAIVYCSSHYVDIKGTRISPIIPESSQIIFYEGKSFIEKEMCNANAIYNASMAIFKKEYAMSVNRQYMNYVAAGDRLFWIELAEMGDVVHVMSPKNYFRQHGNKVSPLKKTKGITSREDFQIVCYLEKKNFIRLLKRPYIRFRYLVDIEKTEFENDSIKKSLLSLWCYNGLIPRWLIHKYGKIYPYLHYYAVYLPLYELRKHSILK